MVRCYKWLHRQDFISSRLSNMYDVHVGSFTWPAPLCTMNYYYCYYYLHGLVDSSVFARVILASGLLDMPGYILAIQYVGLLYTYFSKCTVLTVHKQEVRVRILQEITYLHRRTSIKLRLWMSLSITLHKKKAQCFCKDLIHTTYWKPAGNKYVVWIWVIAVNMAIGTYISQRHFELAMYSKC